MYRAGMESAVVSKGGRAWCGGSLGRLLIAHVLCPLLLQGSLFNPGFTLFQPVPNKHRDHAPNASLFVPSPRHTASPRALAMLRFVGQLMGFSIRNNVRGCGVYQWCQSERLTHTLLRCVRCIFAATTV